MAGHDGIQGRSVQIGLTRVWATRVAPILASVVILLALLNIPYGGPMPVGFTVVLGAAGAALLASTAMSEPKYRERLTLWPAVAILASWALSTITSAFPIEVAQRSWGMAYYSMLFIAAQVICWDRRALKSLALMALAITSVLAIDLWWQRHTHWSLVRNVRAPVLMWNGREWNWSLPSGSLGNRNDQAAIAVLWPLCCVVAPTVWAWGLLGLSAIAAGYVAAVGRSRQLLLGLTAVATAIGLSLRLSWRLKAALMATALVIVAAAVMLSPGIRSRVLEVAQAPLGDRGLPIAYGAHLFLHHPTAGIGPSLFGHYYIKGVRDGWTFAGQPLDQVGMPWVHSLPVEIACELGSVGLLAYGLVTWRVARRLRTAYQNGGHAKELAVAVAASACAFVTMGLIDLTFIKDWVRICWWLVLGLGYAAPTLPGRQEASQTATLPVRNGL